MRAEEQQSICLAVGDCTPLGMKSTMGANTNSAEQYGTDSQSKCGMGNQWVAAPVNSIECGDRTGKKSEMSIIFGLHTAKQSTA